LSFFIVHFVEQQVNGSLLNTQNVNLKLGEPNVNTVSYSIKKSVLFSMKVNLICAGPMRIEDNLQYRQSLYVLQHDEFYFDISEQDGQRELSLVVWPVRANEWICVDHQYGTPVFTETETRVCTNQLQTIEFGVVPAGRHYWSFSSMTSVGTFPREYEFILYSFCE
jgi:hypothetical protein